MLPANAQFLLSTSFDFFFPDSPISDCLRHSSKGRSHIFASIGDDARPLLTLIDMRISTVRSQHMNISNGKVCYAHQSIVDIVVMLELRDYRMFGRIHFGG